MKSTKEEVWTLEKTQILVKIPGNSGHPEYKFVITTKEADGTTKTSQWMQPATGLQDGYRFLQKPNDSNTLVIFGFCKKENGIQPKIVVREERKLVGMTLKTTVEENLK